ncbi:MAG: hypothetical protein L0Y56_19205 [Nitrospira sp.]|nr:hypothetical protein [Nitrospira sp.]
MVRCLLVLLLTLIVAPIHGADEKLSKRGKGVFNFSKGYVQPIFPPSFTVAPENIATALPQGIVVCEFFARVRAVGEYEGKTVIVHETLLKCGDDYFRITGMLFQKE